MIWLEFGENWQLVVSEPVEFEKWLVQVKTLGSLPIILEEFIEHNIVSWEWQYFMEYSSHLVWMIEILSFPHTTVMDLNNVMNTPQSNEEEPKDVNM